MDAQGDGKKDEEEGIKDETGHHPANNTDTDDDEPHHANNTDTDDAESRKEDKTVEAGKKEEPSGSPAVPPESPAKVPRTPCAARHPTLTYAVCICRCAASHPTLTYAAMTCDWKWTHRGTARRTRRRA
jgi:hypothetical protein